MCLATSIVSKYSTLWEIQKESAVIYLERALACIHRSGSRSGFLWRSDPLWIQYSRNLSTISGNKVRQQKGIDGYRYPRTNPFENQRE